jgi:F0F1-type ATP synthase membrane subunit b/b'
MSLHLEPDFSFQLPVQTIIFIGALFSANYYFVRPALRLHQERKRRTTGKIEAAKLDHGNADQLVNTYQKQQKEGLLAARNLRVSEILSGQSESELIVGQSQEEAKKILQKATEELNQALNAERTKIPQLASELSDVLVRKFTGTSALIFLLCFSVGLLSRSEALAAAGGSVDTMTGIVWPYFQFFCFLTALIFFGRKVMTSILGSRRDDLRLKLSEARQAEVQAKQKVTEFSEKLAKLESELEQARRQNVEEGLSERRRMVAEAQKLAAQILVDAEKMANEMVVRGREEIKRELVSSVMLKLEEKLTPDLGAQLDRPLGAELRNVFEAAR